MKRFLQILAIALAIAATVQTIGSFDQIGFTKALASNSPGA